MFKAHKISTLINERKLIDKKFSYVSFCKEIKLSIPGLNNIIEGKSNPKVNTLEAIANYFKVDMNYFFDQPDYIMHVKPPEQVNEPVEEYQQKSSSRNPWELLYDTQNELMEVKVENERLKKGYAPAQDAKVG